VEKQFIGNLSAMSTSSNTSNTKLDVIDGDFLGLLLEQKLRELSSGVRSPYTKQAKGVHHTSTALEDMASACETSSIASTDYDRESLQSFSDVKATLPQTDLATRSVQVWHDRDSVTPLSVRSFCQRHLLHIKLLVLSI
jgi:hypothetical protein